MPKEITFEDAYDKIAIAARIIAKKGNGLFEVNELINEAWIGCGRDKFTSISQAVNASKCDMFDYIRSVVGRKMTGHYKSGKPKKDIKKMAGFAFTNTIDSDTEDKNNPYEQQSIDKRFKQVEDQDFIDNIFKKSDVKEKERDIIKKRFMHDKFPAQIKTEMGLKTITINYYLRKNLRHLQAQCKGLTYEWEEEFDEMIAL